MNFHKIHRIAKHPRRADKSALCAINRHLLDDRFILLNFIIAPLQIIDVYWFYWLCEREAKNARVEIQLGVE